MPDSFSCPLQVIKSVGFTQRDGRLRINQRDQLMVELGPHEPAPHGTCPCLWFTTGGDGQCHDVTGLKHVQPEEVDPFLSLAMERSYIEYSRKRDTSRASDDFEHMTCGRQMDQLEVGQTVMLTPGQFVRRTINTIETFSCHPVRVMIRTADACYQDIPVDGPQPFAAAWTHILKAATPVVPCSREFPMRLKGLRGQRWRVDPAVIQDTLPQQ